MFSAGKAAKRAARTAEEQEASGRRIRAGALADELSMAAKRGDAKRLAELLDMGADPSVAAESSRHPLFDAAVRGHADCVAELLRRCGNVRGGDGATPLLFAATFGTEAEGLAVADLLGPSEALLADGGGEDPLMRAAGSGKARLVKRLLAWSSPLACDSRGLDALMMAAMAGCAGAVRELMPVSDWRRAAQGMKAADMVPKGSPELAEELRSWALACQEREEMLADSERARRPRSQAARKGAPRV